jgi:hypothetical protein
VVGARADSWSLIGAPVHEHLALIGDIEIECDVSIDHFDHCVFGVTTQHPTEDVHIDGADVQVLSMPPQNNIAPTPVSTSWRFLGVDHVVLTTDDLSRTSSEIERILGVPCSRVRDAGSNVMQGFHKLENTIIEVVSGPQVTHKGARWWGFVATVDDIDAWCEFVGPDITSGSRDAVQPGRCIATVKSAVKLGAAIAVMSPHVKTS